MIALTFEAGGNPALAGRILRSLREAGVRATFFLDGGWAEANPDLAREIAGDGHELGNHGYHHSDWTELADDEVLADLDSAEQAICDLTGIKPRPWARPPYGAMDYRVLGLLDAAGYKAVYRDAVDGGHWSGETTPATIRTRVLTSAVEGGVIVFHTDREATAAALPGLLTELRTSGWSLGPLSELGSVPTPRLERHPDFAKLEIRPGHIRPRSRGRWRSLNVVEMGAGAGRGMNRPETVAEVRGARLMLLTGDPSYPYDAGASHEDRHLLVLAGELRCTLRDRAGRELGHVLARQGDLVLLPSGNVAGISCARRWTGLVLK